MITTDREVIIFIGNRIHGGKQCNRKPKLVHIPAKSMIREKEQKYSHMRRDFSSYILTVRYL